MALSGWFETMPQTTPFFMNRVSTTV
jgi:hypothetical protein